MDLYYDIVWSLFTGETDDAKGDTDDAKEPAAEEPAATKIVDDRWDQDTNAIRRNVSFSYFHCSADATIRVRLMEESDLEASAEICVHSFNEFNASVGLSPEFPPRADADVTRDLYANGVRDQSGLTSFVAVNEAMKERNVVVGAIMLDYRDGVGAIGPVCSASPGAGRILMLAAMKEAAEREIKSVRLMQVISNTRSFSLYLALGFEPRRVYMEYVGRCTAHEQQPPDGDTTISVAPLCAADVDECSALHERICGTRRARDIASAVGAPLHPNATARDDAGLLMGYTTGSFLGGHTVAVSEDALRAIVVAQSSAISAARKLGASLPQTTLLVPHQCSGFARWLAKNGFRLTRQLTAMSYGPLCEPSGGYYLPSISY